MPRMRTLFLVSALLMSGLVACGDSSSSSGPADAKVADAKPIDAPAQMGAPDCDTYCTAIQAHCLTTNAQYPSVDQCKATCTAFTVGKLTDSSGNTVGCREYHAGTPAMTDPVTHCPHAGPGGDLVTAAAPGTCGDACTSLCTIHIKTCGSMDAPLTGITPGYKNMAECITACAGFDKTMPYSPSATGNTLACRLYHVTNAALNSAMGNVAATNAHCGHSSETPASVCK